MMKPTTLYIDCHCEAKPGHPYDVAAISPSGEQGIYRGFVPPNTLSFSHVVDRLHMLVMTGDYWPMTFDRPRRAIRGIIPRLPLGPYGWWHNVHGVSACAGRRGESVKIGVIDEALPRQSPDSPLAHIENLGAAAWDCTTDRPFRSLGSEHGIAVCSVLGARRNNPHGFEGVAPDATIYFCAAGADDSERLNPTRLANSIAVLSEEYQCDIVTFSAGDVEEELPELQAAVEDATDNGTLCFTAAGNRGAAPLYPARYPECLAVGAIGKLGFAAPGSADARDAQAAVITAGELFFWNSSARGPGVDFLGGGVSVIFTDPAGGAFPVTGTSAAAPTVAGVAAAILSKDKYFQSLRKDKKRVEYALGKLNSMSSNVFPGLSAAGILMA